MLTQPMMLRPPESTAKRPRRADLSVIAAVQPGTWLALENRSYRAIDDPDPTDTPR
jgi:hypothetical protein